MRTLRALPKLPILLALFAAVLPMRAFAEGVYQPPSNNTPPAILLGGRFMGHYNFQQVLSTPPASLLGEFTFLLFRSTRNKTEIGFLGGMGVYPTKALEFGVTFRYTPLVIRRVSFGIVTDLVYYKPEDPPNPLFYDGQIEMDPRIGMVILIRLWSGMYLEGDASLSIVKSNLFVAPLGAIRFEF